MTVLRAVVVGSGWGGHAARALAADPRVTLCSIVGRGSERTHALAQALDVGVDATLDIALAAHAPAVVVLAIGERAHEALAVRALDAGAHVLCAHPVAPDGLAVLRIARAARCSGRLARTDYTFRLRPELAALRASAGRGALMRVSIEAPGRWLPIALDTAVALAGPVARLVANAALPPSLADRFAKTPQAFPPAVQMEHRSGGVTSIVAFPHSWPGAPVRVRTSWERGSVEALLPSGGARSLACARDGAVQEIELVARSRPLEEADEHGRAMQAVAGAFIDTLSGAPDLLATLEEEAHLRAIWSALWRSSRASVPVEVTDPA